MNAVVEYAKNGNMKSILIDPVVLICAGVILVGILGFFWGIKQFRKGPRPALGDLPLDEQSPLSSVAPEIEFRAPTISQPLAPAVPAVSREVSDRLESMTQRLAEMQSVLLKQSANSGAGAAQPQGGVGQGFSPETIDKLLKIVGNVIQQVDILQKSLNAPK